MVPVVLHSGAAATPPAANVSFRSVAATRASDFLNGLGVNIHLGQAGNGPKAVIVDMAYLGLDHVRDHGIGPRASSILVANFSQLAAAGLRFDWLTGADLSATWTDLHKFVLAHPGTVTSIEGPNEVNNYPVTYAGATGTAGAVAYQTALYSMAHGDTLLASIPVLEFTDNGLIAAPADATNVHPYPQFGAQPSAGFTTAYQRHKAFMPGGPVYFTEAGYTTMPFAAGGGGVDQATQAKLTLNMVVDAVRIGVKATYLYDLVDDGADPAGSFGPDHFGLFTFSGAAKPAALAIHNFTTILADPGAANASFAPKPLSYSISGLPASGSSYVVEKSSGVYNVIVWAEPPIWNASRHSAVAATPQSVTVDFAQTYSSISVFDPLTSAVAQQTTANASNVTINVTDHPVIVQVK